MTRKPHARRRALRHALTLAVATALLSPAFATVHAQAAATPDGSREATELDAVIVTGRNGEVMGFRWAVARVAGGEHAGAWMTIAVSPPVPVGNAI